MRKAEVGASGPGAVAWRTLTRRAKVRRVATAIVAMAAVLLAGPDAVANTASGRAASSTAQPPTGQDVSWPQCPAGAGGYGLPMPAPNAAFVVVGLTAGRGFTANPCVAAQVAWARRHGVPTSAYLVPTYPTRQEMRRWGTRGRGSGTSLRDRVFGVGWAQGRDALAVLAASGLRARSVWIDVERSRTRPWSPDPDANTALVQGVAAALRHAGFLAGLYTNSSSWTDYTDGVQLGLPEWRTVGPRTRAAALAACGAQPLNGGPVLMVQSWTTTVDTDAACPVLASRTARLRWFAAP